MDSEKKDITNRQAPEKKTIISKVCEKHGPYNSEREIIGSGRFMRNFDSSCPICETEEEQQRVIKRQEACERIRKSNHKNCLASVGIPKRYKGINLSDMEPINEAQKVIIERCKKYIDKFDDLKELGTSLIFTGRPGTGKTHIALSMIDPIIKSFCDNDYNENIQKDFDRLTLSIPFNHSCLYVNTYDLFADIKATYNKNSHSTEAEILRKYSTVDVLTLDEVGVQSGSDYESMMLFRIINARYENMRPTFIISNLSEKDLSDYIGERTIDRFYENNGAVFVFDWESNRIK